MRAGGALGFTNALGVLDEAAGATGTTSTVVGVSGTQPNWASDCGGEGARLEEDSTARSLFCPVPNGAGTRPPAAVTAGGGAMGGGGTHKTVGFPPPLGPPLDFQTDKPIARGV